MSIQATPGGAPQADLYVCWAPHPSRGATAAAPAGAVETFIDIQGDNQLRWAANYPDSWVGMATSLLAAVSAQPLLGLKVFVLQSCSGPMLCQLKVMSMCLSAGFFVACACSWRPYARGRCLRRSTHQSTAMGEAGEYTPVRWHAWSISRLDFHGTNQHSPQCHEGHPGEPS